jgi:glycosyltransferase involved in cell wall biosynthesis
MRILYITHLWTGFEEILCGGKTQIAGMPGFIYPLRELVREGHQIDLIICPDRETQFKTSPSPTLEWLGSINVIDRVNFLPTILGQISGFSRLFFKVLKLLFKQKYDFIYGHGNIPVAANLAAILLKIPYGQRLYGTALLPVIKKRGLCFTIFRHWQEYLAFTLPKKFLLITDDGTNGDIVLEKLYPCFLKKKFDFYFWKNGVNLPPPILSINNDEIFSKCKYLLYAARVSSWKGQIRALELLLNLRKNYNLDIRLYLIGQIDDTAYKLKLENYIHDNQLTDCVTFSGGMPQSELYKIVPGAIANLFMYDMSNRGNVLYETLSYGGLVMALDPQHSLKNFVINGYNGYVTDSIDEMAKLISTLHDDCSLRGQICENAKQSITKLLKSWDERISDEINLISNSR